MRGISNHILEWLESKQFKPCRNRAVYEAWLKVEITDEALRRDSLEQIKAKILGLVLDSLDINKETYAK